MSEYKPTEYVVDFGDYRSNQFVRLSMALIEHNGAKLQERIVRCRDCKDYRASDATCHSWQWHNWDAAIEVEPDGFCAWAERKESGDD